ncbi:MAG: CheR family methyltransferase, partial [Gemmatimonadales bacterium]
PPHLELRAPDLLPPAAAPPEDEPSSAVPEPEPAADPAGGGGDPLTSIVLVRSLANRGDLDAAGRTCAAALDRHRTSSELAYLHAVLLAEAGRYADAATAARRALYLDRGLVVAHLSLGGALARMGDADGARRSLRNALRLLAAMAPEQVVPASDGASAGRLAEMALVHARLLSEAAA